MASGLLSRLWRYFVPRIGELHSKLPACRALCLEQTLPSLLAIVCEGLQNCDTLRALRWVGVVENDELAEFGQRTDVFEHALLEIRLLDYCLIGLAPAPACAYWVSQLDRRHVQTQKSGSGHIPNPEKSQKHKNK